MMKKTEPPVVVEQSFAAPVETVWQALTDIVQMRQWYFDNIPAFKPEAGFETQFDIQNGGRNFRHMWKVTEVVPLNMIAYDWKYQEYPGDSQVIFELFKQDSGTKLRLTHRVREDFPEDIPEFSRESCVEGWIFFIRKSLTEFLHKNY